MDSINFCESAIAGLHRQAKQRLICLMLVLSCWVIGVTVIFLVSHALMGSGQKKTVLLQNILEEMKPGISQAEDHDKRLKQQKISSCAAQVLEALTISPVKGVSVSFLSFSDEWEIQGGTIHSEDMLAFKTFMQSHLNNIVLTQDNTVFTLKGKMKC